MLMNKISNK